MSVLVLVLDKKERIVNFLNTNNSSNKSNSNPIYDDVLVEDVQTGAETFSFSTICKNGIDKDLVVGNYVSFQKDGKYKLFQITRVEITHGDTFEISVYSECAGLSLINNVFRKLTLNSCTIQRFIEAVVENTDWNLGKVDFSIQNTVDLDIPDTSCYAALQNNIGKFECEIEFRVEINNGRISKKFIDVYTRRGKVTGKRFTYGKDIENVIKTSDSSELRTALIGIGKNGVTFRDVQVEGIDKPIGQDFVADEKAFEMYNKNGYHLMGVYNVDSTSPEEILRETYKQLKRVCEPKTSYDIPVFMLGNDVNIGDYIGVFDSEFNPPLKLMARVVKLETCFTDTQKSRCLLSNFIEVSSNITDEMRKLASELEGYVDNSVNAKFPIGGEDIKDDAIKGNHIYENTITTNHLQADSVTATKIKADSIESKHIKSDSIDTGKIQADSILSKHIKAGEITTGHIKAGTITAESGIIADAAIGTAQIKDAEITVAKIQNGFVDNLVVKQGKFQSAHIGELTSENIAANAITTIKLNAKAVTAEKIDVGAITADKINANAVTAEKLNANSVTADKIAANAITTDKINTSAVNADKIAANAITTDKVNALAITSEKIAANSITADKIAANSITTGKIDAGAITTDKLGANSVTANKIAANAITAGKIDASVINSIEVNASNITAEKISSGEIKVGNANIVDGSISGAKIAKASISNAQINEAFIADAFIKNITADKIKGGIFDAKSIIVKNLSAESITVGQINGTQIAPGAIGKDKLDELLSSEIKNTSDNVNKALEDVGLVKSEVVTINGTLNKTVKTVDVEYYLSTSSTSTVGGAWQTIAPQWVNNKFMWSRQKVTYVDGTSVTRNETCIAGAIGPTGKPGTNGNNGTDGKGISSIVEYYSQNTSSSTPSADDTFTTNRPEWKDGSFIWTKTKITYTDNSVTWTTPICVTGGKGATGSVGASGVSITKVDVWYYLSTSNTSQTGGTWQTTAPTWVNGKYMWSKTITSFSNGQTTESTPVCITGAKGDTGNKGTDGRSISSVAEEYYLSSSKTSLTGGTWQATPPTWQPNYYMWTRTRISYVNPSGTEYTKEVCDSSWEAIDGMQMDSRNLILNSATTKISGGENGGSVFLDFSRQLTDNFKNIAGKQILLSFDLELDNAIEALSSYGMRVGIELAITYADNTMTYAGKWYKPKVGESFTGRLVSDPFTLKKPITKIFGGLYIQVKSTRCVCSLPKMEFGTKTTGYSEAPEDTDKKIEEVTTIANGKNSIYYSATPPTATGKKENDIWYDTDDGYKMYYFKSGSWSEAQFGTNALAINAITADKIAASSITSGKIATGAVTTDKLYALSVTSEKVAANAITAGKIAANSIVAGNISANAITTEKISANSINSDKLDVDELFVGENAFVRNLKAIEIDASNITTGKISSERLDITGLVSFEAFDKKLQPVFDTSGDKTYINGGMIAANSVTAEQLNVKGLTVKNTAGKTTLAVTKDGDIQVDGSLKSDNFQSDLSGYQISTDGSAEFNQVKLRGDVILPNAGITNFGAIIGNENLLFNSDFSHYVENPDIPWDKSLNGILQPGSAWSTGYTSGAPNADKVYHAHLNVNDFGFPVLKYVDTDGVWKGITQSLRVEKRMKPNQKYSISFDAYYTEEGMDTLHGGIYNKLVGAASYAFNDGTYRVTKIPSKKWVRVGFTFTSNEKLDESASQALYLYGYSSGVKGTAYIKNVKLEMGNPTPWCLATNEKGDCVRFWAGASYEGRNEAPFRVLQSGKVFATEGTFDGTFTGKIKIGNISIEDTNTTDGAIEIKTNNDLETIIKLSNGPSFINAPITIGNLKDKNFDFNGNVLNVNKSVINVDAGNVNKVSLNENGIDINSKISNGKHSIHYGIEENKKETLLIESTGSKGNDGDVNFLRKNGTEDIKVKVTGEMSVKSKITSDTTNIEMRYQSDGIYFYAT